MLAQSVIALMVTVAVIAGIHHMQETTRPPVVDAVRPGGDIVFASGSPQLSAIVVSSVQAQALPLAGPQAGRVAYNESRTVRVSAPVAGRIVRLLAETGGEVRRDAVLADIDAPDLGTAEADLEKARADALRKARAAARAQSLFDGQVLASKDLENAQAELAQARAETRRALLRMRNLNGASASDGLFHLRAPLGGMITERQVNPGQEVRPDLTTPLFVISDLTQLWIVVDTQEALALKLHVGQQATVVSDTWPGIVFAATVDHVAPVLDPATRRMQVRCRVRNDSGKLRPEMFVRVSFHDSETQARAVGVPSTAVFADGKYSAVFVEVGPGRFRKRHVTVLRTLGQSSFIGDGLDAGERIVTEGAFLLTTESGDADPAT